MAAGIVICSLPPFIMERIKKPSWNIAHPDEVLLDVYEDAAVEPVAGTVSAARAEPVVDERHKPTRRAPDSALLAADSKEQPV